MAAALASSLVASDALAAAAAVAARASEATRHVASAAAIRDSTLFADVEDAMAPAPVSLPRLRRVTCAKMATARHCSCQLCT